jgi:hypothetical protein
MISAIRSHFGGMLDRPTRGAIRILRRSLKRRDPRRRYNCRDQCSPAWEERAEEAVTLLVASPIDLTARPRLQVGDLGAGNQRLLRVLERDLAVPIEYHAYDLHPQAKEVHRIDLQRELPTRVFDVVFCLGLLEYLRDLDQFVSRLRSICRCAVVSYVITDPPDSLTPAERRERSWLSDLTQMGLEELFRRHSYTRQVFALTNAGRTGLWVWSATEDAADPRT